MTAVAVVGDGQMGLVLADALVCRGLDVRIWGPFEESIESLKESRKSPRLPGFTLDDSVLVTSIGKESLDGVEVVVNAIPTQFIRNVWEQLSADLPTDVPVGCVAKGIELETLELPTQILTSAIGDNHAVCVLSGPTIATELVRRQPAVMVSSSTDEKSGKSIARFI